MDKSGEWKKVWKYLCIAGLVSVAAYVVHVVLGGFLWQGYDHLQQSISSLTGVDGPNRELLNNILLAYAIPGIVFGLSAYLYLRGFAPKIAQVGMLLYFIMQIISFAYKFFPEDAQGAAMSFSGTMHIVITYMIVPLTILAPIFIGVGFRKLGKFKSFGAFCIFVGIFIFCAGGTTTVIFANGLDYFGLAERINIGMLQLWTVLLALKLLRTDTADLGKYVKAAAKVK
jgi:hypothetical protein